MSTAADPRPAHEVPDARAAETRRRRVRRTLLAGALASSLGLTVACGAVEQSTAGTGTSSGSGTGTSSSGSTSSWSTGSGVSTSSGGSSHATSSGS